jgi:hypothetical protein
MVGDIVKWWPIALTLRFRDIEEHNYEDRSSPLAY